MVRYAHRQYSLPHFVNTTLRKRRLANQGEIHAFKGHLARRFERRPRARLTGATRGSEVPQTGLGDRQPPCVRPDPCKREFTMPASAVDDLSQAVSTLQTGGVVAYPTEAVYGLGCDPHDRAAFERVFALKRRPPTQGVLLIAADFAQVEKYVDRARVPADALARVRASWPGPHTWIFPRAATVPDWIAGSHAGIALRVTAHPPAAALCRAFGGAIVSTSANRHGEPPARTADAVRAAFGDELVFILDGAVGGLERPTPIRDALTGDFLRS
jgi:L-threonylcarbamoyladenylate synthase